MNNIRIKTLNVSTLKEFINTDLISFEGINIALIGQAGFIRRFNQSNYVIDPYISDSLASKY